VGACFDQSGEGFDLVQGVPCGGGIAASMLKLGADAQ
jgi:hypothetical protein